MNTMDESRGRGPPLVKQEAISSDHPIHTDDGIREPLPGRKSHVSLNGELQQRCRFGVPIGHLK